MGEVVIRYVDLPCVVRGLTIIGTDGCYNIYINAKLSLEMQRAALTHELAHVERDDIYRTDEPLSVVERMIR